MDIGDWRAKIDEIDEQLVRLLNRRSTCAIEIGRLKRKLEMAVYSPSREKQVIEHVIGANPGPLDGDAIRRLFERIIDESRRIERVTMEREDEERKTSREGAASAAGPVRKVRGRRKRAD